MFNSFKLLSQISVTDTNYFLLTSSVVTGVTSVRVDKQTTCYQSKEDRVLIKMLRVEKGHSAKRLMAEFPRRNWCLAAVKHFDCSD